MKKISNLLIISLLTAILIFPSFIKNSYATNGLSISASSKSVSEGSTFTVTVKASSSVFVEGLSLKCSGGTIVSSLGKSSLDKGETTTAKIKLTGDTCTVTVTGTSANYETETEASASASVTVTKKVTSSSNGTTSNNNSSSSSSNNSNNSSSQTTQTKDTRSKDNTLSSLTVSEGTMSPSFNASKTTYDIELSGTVSEVTIDAKANDSKASVSGTGKKSLKVGNNTYSVVCTAENGSKKTYTLNFYVDEAPLVYTKYNDIDLGVIRLLDKVKAPDGFEKKTIQLEGQDIEGYTNSKLNMNIAYLVDEKGNKDFYVIEDGKVVSVYQTITVNGRVYVVLNQPTDLQEVKDLQTTTLTIDDVELSGWLFNDENLKNYSLVYLMNSEGQKHLYVYESTEGTLQIYTPSQVSNQSMNTMTYIFIGTTIFFALTTLLTMIVHMKFKKKSIASIKAYYEKRNRG